MINTEIKRNLIEKMTCRNLEAYAEATDKLVFIADLIDESVDSWKTEWLDQQFEMWATELELV